MILYHAAQTYITDAEIRMNAANFLRYNVTAMQAHVLPIAPRMGPMIGPVNSDNILITGCSSASAPIFVIKNIVEAVSHIKARRKIIK